MFELVQLRSFIAVAEELHFGRAAYRLHMTQPPLSRRIQRLEEILGVKLFNRTNRRVELTVAGAGFLTEAKRILRLAENAARSVKRIDAGAAGQVVIGFTATSGYEFLPTLLKRLTRAFPGVDFVLRENVSTEQLDALEAGGLDLAFLRAPVDPLVFETLRVHAERLVVAVPQTHDLASRDLLSVGDLAGERIVSYAPIEGRYFHNLTGKVFDRAGIVPNYAQTVSQVHTVLALVQAGMGVALVPEAARALHFMGVRLLPINHLPEDSVELLAAWRPDNSNPALRETIKALRRHVRTATAAHEFAVSPQGGLSVDTARG
ncbi:MAG TPA: LysR family transcriptional regulator [Bauldia sp.]|nr:LysR family transcriptional regulator [Bauldia sp.]